MKSIKCRSRGSKAVTLIEVMLVLGLLVLIGGSGLAGWNAYSIYREQLQVESALSQVAFAQRAYLTENPTMTYTGLTDAMLAPYLPGGVMPSVPSGTAFNVRVFPPSATKGTKTWIARDF